VKSASCQLAATGSHRHVIIKIKSGKLIQFTNFIKNYTFALFKIYIKNKWGKSYLQAVTIRLSAISFQQSVFNMNKKLIADG